MFDPATLTPEEKVIYLENTVRVIRGSGVERKLSPQQRETVEKIEALLERLKRKPTL